MTHPWPSGQIFYSAGGHFCYQVIGPCCRLFDREQLPWPCCRLQWQGKEPSWRRIGKRFVPDMATRNYPSYAVQILNQGIAETFVFTLYTAKLSATEREWWYSKKPARELTSAQIQANSQNENSENSIPLFREQAKGDLTGRSQP